MPEFVDALMLVSGTRLTVYIIWWAVLVIALLVIVPLTVFLLHRLYRAARGIDRYSERTLAAGVGIAGNTAAIPALDQTIATATEILGTAGQIEQHTRAMKEALAGRVQ